MTRIFFACDCHGSVPVFRKMLQVHNAYKCSVIMMCGDLTGKAVAPIVQEKENLWWSAPFGKKEVYKSKEQVEQAKKIYEKRGFYCYLTTPDELEKLKNDPQTVTKIFRELMCNRIGEWIEAFEDKIPQNIEVILNPGNDDIPEIDEIIKSSKRVTYPIGKVVEIDKIHKMITCEWVNNTPWNTPKECGEEELDMKFENEFKRVDDHRNLICNFHAPPYGTRLDVAPKIDEQLKVKGRWGRPEMVHVGSHAVRDKFEKYQPLLGLHGHIHESAGTDHVGRTLCVNAGSIYTQGMLSAFVIDLPDKTGGKIALFEVCA